MYYLCGMVYLEGRGGGGRLLECKNPPPVLVNAPPPLLHACQLSAYWALVRTVTVYLYFKFRHENEVMYLATDRVQKVAFSQEKCFNRCLDYIENGMFPFHFYKQRFFGKQDVLFL